jgi:hypothetical protein
MTALTEDRNTQRRYVERIVGDDALIAANTTVWNGSMVCADPATGALRPAADVAGLTFVGVAQLRMVNLSGSPAKVKPAARCAVGVYKFATTGANALTAADLQKPCFILDDQTVVRQAGTANAIPAGTVDSIDPDGQVWVKAINL